MADITDINCQTTFSNMLTGITCSWKWQLIQALCAASTNETLTFLSEFVQNGNQYCITYTDEHGSQSVRCFVVDGGGGSGFSGYSGYSGYSGVGIDGLSGYSGFSGQDGAAAFSGYSGFSGAGFSGYSGYSGYSGFSGSGISGYSGYSGSNPGLSGYSGYSGANPGQSGYSGFSGANPGASGFSGYSGYSGFSGAAGISGFSGTTATITADNGLIMSTPTNVQLGAPVLGGAPLLHTSYIDHTGGDFQLIFTGDSGNGSPLLYANGGQQGIFGQGSTTGVTGQANSIPLWGINTTTTTTVAPGLVLNRSATTGGTGEGSSIQWNLQNSINAVAKAGDIVVKYTNGTSGAETAQMVLSLANIGNASQTLVTIDGDGTSTFLGPYSPINTVRAINTIHTAVKGETTTGNAIFGNSTLGVGGAFNSGGSNVGAMQAFNSAGGVGGKLTTSDITTGTVLEVLELNRASTGTPINGIGGSIDLWLGTDTQPTGRLANQIVWNWIDVTDATRTSELDIKGVNNALVITLLQIKSTGIFILTQGLQNFADDTAAATGGIPVNGLYRNGSVIMIRVS